MADAGLGSAAPQLKNAASSAFFDGFAIGCLVAAGVALVGALAAAVLLPTQPVEAADDATEFLEYDADRDELTPERRSREQRTEPVIVRLVQRPLPPSRGMP
jgi:hypothetical protein